MQQIIFRHLLPGCDTMARTQDIVDTLESLMKADNNFANIAHFTQTAYSSDNFSYPFAAILVENDGIEILGMNKSQHVLNLEIIFASNQWGNEGQRATYHFADALETLLVSNRQFTLTTGEVLDVRLTQKTYGLEFSDDGNVDGVNCQVEVRFMVSA